MPGGVAPGGSRNVVALVSSGDPGIYGMASLAIELSSAEGVSVPIEVVPGGLRIRRGRGKARVPALSRFRLHQA